MSPARLKEMINEATVDCHDESEQVSGLYTMLEDELLLPFETEMLGMRVVVERVELGDDESIQAVCTRGRARQRISLIEVPLPTPLPRGAEWIEAYRRWARGRSG